MWWLKYKSTHVSQLSIRRSLVSNLRSSPKRGFGEEPGSLSREQRLVMEPSKQLILMIRTAVQLTNLSQASLHAWLKSGTFPSCNLSLHQNESSLETIHRKMYSANLLIFMQINLIFTFRLIFRGTRELNKAMRALS